jgi:hypothetical protein
VVADRYLGSCSVRIPAFDWILRLNRIHQAPADSSGRVNPTSSHIGVTVQLKMQFEIVIEALV